MDEQIKIWKGEFGNAYTDRCDISYMSKVGHFKEMIAGLDLRSILEVGCNRGINLLALRHLLGDKVKIQGVEPNEYAAGLARDQGFTIYDGAIYKLPFPDNYFDLVFTNGVLIHVPLEKLSSAIKEMYRVSKHYLLAAEYYAPEETEIIYRGHHNLLWKRNFYFHFKNTVPVYMMRQGQYTRGSGPVNWWLFGTSGIEDVYKWSER